jgi:proteasome accessory factor C
VVGRGTEALNRSGALVESRRMSTVARDRIRRCLAMIPLIRARPGIRIPELASIFGVRAEEIWADITEVLTLCGVPPYLPHNYLVFSIHGDQVSIRFADHLSRPVHLTLQEALAIDLALRSISGGSPPTFGDAAPRLRSRLRALLRGSERVALEAFDRGVAGTPPPDVVTQTIGVLKEAMARNVAAEIEYYTAGRDVVGRRVVEPYGLVDHRGNWYVVARDAASGREAPFRVDRIRLARLLPGEEYEVPDAFTTEAYRRDELYTQDPADIEVRVAFTADAAPRVREETPSQDLTDLPGGGVLRVFRIPRDRPRWLYTHLGRYGKEAEVLEPEDVRRGMAAFLDQVLAGLGAPRGERASEAARVESAHPTRGTATAAAGARRKRPSTKRRPG